MAFTSSAKASSLPHDPDDFEDHVKHVLEKDYGYEVVKPPRNEHGYDLEVKRDGRSIAVQVKNHRRPINTAQVQKFARFMELEISNRQFSEAWFISSRGFSKPAIANFVCESKKDETSENLFAGSDVESITSSRVNFSLGTVYQNGIKWDYLDPQSSLQNRNSYSPPPPASDQGETRQEELRRYFGIFTAKGGTGKTTVAAHLAGSFALLGYDVVLLDVDPEKNLTKLFRQGNYLDNIENENDIDASLHLAYPGRAGNMITVLSHDQWKDCEGDHNDAKIIICDCSPSFTNNPPDLVEKFNYCVIPTSLNPLGIAKNSDVIRRTFKDIRTKNNQAEMFVLINNYHEDTKNSTFRKNNKLLLNLLDKQIKSYFDKDKKSHLISPYDCAIHYSQSLFYWGLHVVTGGEPKLAFKEHGGKSIPRSDFFGLADYLENHDRVSLTKT